MWRPEGWKNPYHEQTPANAVRRYDYEAGANAILKALKEQGTVLYVPANNWFSSIPIIQPVAGVWVFIPDEE